MLTVEKKDRVALVRLNRPKVNALSQDFCKEIGGVFKALDSDESVTAIVLTGNDKAFCAGADIKEMQSKSFVDVYKGKMGSGETASNERTNPKNNNRKSFR